MRECRYKKLTLSEMRELEKDKQRLSRETSRIVNEALEEAQRRLQSRIKSIGSAAHLFCVVGIDFDGDQADAKQAALASAILEMDDMKML